MHATRREFFVNVAVVAGSLALQPGISAAQNSPTPPPPPTPGYIPNPAEVHSDPAAAAAAKRALLLKNEQEFREGVERLHQLTSSLREELQRTMTTEVFSVRIYKQTEAIEKLAKSLKTKAKAA